MSQRNTKITTRKIPATGNKVLVCTGSFPTGTPRRIHVDSMWVLRRYVEDQISTNFHLISEYFFDVISIVEKSTLFPHTFFQCNFDDLKIHIVSTYYYRCNFKGRNMHIVFTYFFRRNFDGQRFDFVFGKL